VRPQKEGSCRLEEPNFRVAPPGFRIAEFVSPIARILTTNSGMNYRIICFTALVTLCAGTAAAGSVAPVKSIRNVEASIKDRVAKFRAASAQAVRSGNYETMLGYYAEGVRLMPEYQRTVMGKTNAAAYHAAFTARFNVRRYERAEMELLDLGTRVVEVGRFTLVIAPKKSEREHELVGKYLDIWEKSETGVLSLHTSAWNYDHRVDIAEALRFAEVPAIQTAMQARLPVRDRISFEMAARGRLLETVVAQHDAKTWKLFYADDVVLLHSFSPPLVGRKAVDAFIENHVKHLPVFEKLDIRNDRIDDLGDYVVEYASHVANWRNGDASGVSTGKNICIWQKDAAGSYKIFRSIGAYD
jgi:ketosteroid isomerase-like protein